MSSKRREWIPVELKSKLLKQRRSCYYCHKRRKPEEVFEVDHIVPIIRGGTNHETNLIVACRKCNRAKGTKRAGRRGEWVKLPQDKILSLMDSILGRRRGV